MKTLNLGMRELYELEPMKYFSMPKTLSTKQRQEKLDLLLNSQQYIFSLKTDGNWARTIWQDGELIIQSRGISKKTGTYGELQDKVLFSDAIREAFHDTTLLLGEIYLDNGRDKEVGSILRCLTDKALARQTEKNILKYRIFDCWYYNGIDLTQTPIKERIKYLPMAAKEINHPLVSYVKYYEARPDNFYSHLNSIFEKDGEGVVLYHQNCLPCEGATSAWDTLKVKREMEFDADCFIVGIEPPEKHYNGKELESWQFWVNEKTDEKLIGDYFAKHVAGEPYAPITKFYYYNYPGAIKCAVWGEDNEQIVLCKCSSLTDELRASLRD